MTITDKPIYSIAMFEEAALRTWNPNSVRPLLTGADVQQLQGFALACETLRPQIEAFKKYYAQGHQLPSGLPNLYFPYPSVKLDPKQQARLVGALGLLGETMEYAQSIFAEVLGGDDIDEDAALLEIYDIAWYIAVATHDGLGKSMSEGFGALIYKLYKRYGEAFDPEKSKARYNKDGK